MNGMKPKFLENATLSQSYYEMPNPYVNPERVKYNLRELARYAKERGKEIAELTQEEVEKFRV